MFLGDSIVKSLGRVMLWSPLLLLGLKPVIVLCRCVCGACTIDNGTNRAVEITFDYICVRLLSVLVAANKSVHASPTIASMRVLASGLVQIPIQL